MQFKREKWELRQMQAMPLRLKIQMTAQRIESWYEYWEGYNTAGRMTARRVSTSLSAVARTAPCSGTF